AGQGRAAGRGAAGLAVGEHAAAADVVVPPGPGGRAQRGAGGRVVGLGVMISSTRRAIPNLLLGAPPGPLGRYLPGGRKRITLASRADSAGLAVACRLHSFGEAPGGAYYSKEVTCLNVVGNEATIGIEIEKF